MVCVMAYNSTNLPLLDFVVSLCCFHQDPEQLFQACEEGNLEVVHRFLAAGIDVDIKDTVSTCLCGVGQVPMDARSSSTKN